MSLLKVSGTKIVDENDKEVILRGAGLGGWMKYATRFDSANSFINCYLLQYGELHFR